MGSLIAKVVSIKSVESLHIVQFEFYGHPLSMITLELNQKISVGTSYSLCVKPSNVILAKSKTQDVTIANQLPCKIIKIQKGMIVSNITLECFEHTLEALITTHRLEAMDLQVEQNMYAYINESDLSLSQQD